MVKALIDAGATADISDDFGRTPLDRAKDIKPGRSSDEDCHQSLELILTAVARESASTPNYIDGVTRKANEIRQLAEKYGDDGEWLLAMEKYRQVLQFSNCENDFPNHRDLAICALNHAVDKTINGEMGGRASFKVASDSASKAVEIEPKFELGWEVLARAYLGYRELPRAKEACANGMKHFPASNVLSDIWSVLDKAGVPDVVVDHKSQEFKDIYQRIYINRWVGEVSCDYCALNCMEEPRPEKCPFCGCPNEEIGDDTDMMIINIIIYGNKDPNSDPQHISMEEDDDSDDSEIPELAGNPSSASNQKAFSFAAPSQSGSISFDFGSTSNKTESKFVFGLGTTKAEGNAKC